MRRILVIDDHGGFHTAMGRAVLAGGALALFPALITGIPGWAWALGGVLLLGAAIAPPRTLRQGAWLLLCALFATTTAGSGQVLGIGFSLCLGLSIAGGDLLGWQRVLTVLFTLLLGLGASRLPRALLEPEVLNSFWHGLPGQVGVLLGGMGTGLILGSAAIVRQLRVRVEAVDRELLSLLPVTKDRGAGEPDDEIRRVLLQSVATYQEAAEALTDHPAALAVAEDLVKKIARFGRRWREIEAQANKSDPAEIAARIEELHRRQEATSDEQARAEYERAQAALGVQLGYLSEIRSGRERAVARLHHQVATLERLRLAAVRHLSADAARQGEELRAVIEDLSQAGRDLDCDAEALTEVPG